MARKRDRAWNYLINLQNKNGVLFERDIESILNRYMLSLKDRAWIYKKIDENIEERVKKCLEFNHRKIEFPIISKNRKNYISKEHFTEFNACNLFPKFMEVNVFDENNAKTKKNKEYTDKYIIRKPEVITDINYEYGNFEVFSLSFLNLFFLLL